MITFQNWSHVFPETMYHVRHKTNIVTTIARNPSNDLDSALYHALSVNGAGANKLFDFYKCLIE